MASSPKRLAWLIATSATWSVLAGGQYAAAEESAAAAQPAGAQVEPENAALQTVVVTAQKRTEALQKVPDAVTALQTGDLARQGAVKLTDYAADVPGLNLISSTPGQSIVILRGITTGFSVGSPSTVSTYVDDVPYGSATASAYGSIATLDLDPGILQRVEVLRGPQGTLYGAGAFGGVIKYDTTLPSLTDYRGRAELDGSAVDGGGDGGGARAMLDGPLVKDKLGITLSAFDRHDPGYIDDPHRNARNINSSESYGGRAALLWRPTDRLSSELSAIDQETFTDGQSVADMNSNLTPIYGRYAQARNGNELWHVRSRLYSLRVSYDLSWATIASISSYQMQAALWSYDLTIKRGAAARAATGVPDLGVFEHVVVDHKKDTQELRITSPNSDRLEWLAGLFYTHEWGLKDENFQPISILTDMPVSLPQPLFRDILNDSYTEYAAYGDLTYYVSPKFKILSGIRYSSDSEDSVTPFTGVLAGVPTVTVGKSSDTSTTYLVSPSYDINANNMVYARVASGFRPGGPTNVPPASLLGGAPESYGPDSLTNYELGYKGVLPEQRMTVDLSAFDVEWKDMQIRTVVSGFFVTGNAAGARSSGLELDWSWEPVNGLRLAANAAYTDAKLTADAPAIGGKSGDELPDVPRVSGNVAADYEFPISAELAGFFGGNVQYEGARHQDFVASKPLGYVAPEMPAHTVGNLHVGVAYTGFSVEAYIKNVANSYGMTRISSLMANGYSPPLAVGVIQPRTFGLSLSKEF